MDDDGDTVIDLTERYAYDAWNPLKGEPIGNENWDVLADLTGGNGLKMRYVRGDAVDELFGRLNAAGSGWWTLTDQLGSVREVVTLGRVVQDSLHYDG